MLSSHSHPPPPPLSDPPPRAPTLRPRPYSSSIGTHPPALRSCCPPSRFAPPWPPPIRTAREASSTPSRPCSDTELTLDIQRGWTGGLTSDMAELSARSKKLSLTFPLPLHSQFPSSKNHHSPLHSSFQSGLD
ncbi:hypothetical protein PVAP13_5NG572466 [Panicum virgatum]|uniref:Uncharacterized protein n=1 Tax=Panicum virgatum TaxID=38727 RepID=A0A8T0S4V7_PANVG|nr:hypothetical protein PVAP13_5NG572466 [Panicum virgatum]